MGLQMYAAVKMNRPVDKEKDFIFAGPYEMAMAGKDIRFDFVDIMTTVDRNDPTIIHICNKNPDYEYENTGSIATDGLKSISEIRNFSVYADDDSDLEPVELLSVTFGLNPPYDEFQIRKDVLKNAVLSSELP